MKIGIGYKTFRSGPLYMCRTWPEAEVWKQLYGPSGSTEIIIGKHHIGFLSINISPRDIMIGVGLGKGQSPHLYSWTKWWTWKRQRKGR